MTHFDLLILAFVKLVGLIAIFGFFVWGAQVLILKLVDCFLDLAGVRSEVCFFITNRKRIRAAIGEDPELLANWQQWRISWRKRYG